MLRGTARVASLATLFVIGIATLPARALAADALVLAIGGDASDELAREARSAVSAALEADGVSVVPDAEIALRVSPSRLRALASLADARGLANELEARMIVGVAVWMREGEPAGPASVAVSMLLGARSYSSTRDVGEAGLAAAASEALSAVRADQTRAMMIEGPASSAPSASSGSETSEGGALDPAQVAAGAQSSGGREAGRGDTTPGFDIIGPTMLLAFGAAGIGLGVYALLDGTCELRSPMGTCLRGEDPNEPVGVTLIIAGVLAMAGGVVWLVTGAVVADTAPIDIVLGPDGGELFVRGRF